MCLMLGLRGKGEISAFTGICLISILPNCGRKVNENYSWGTVLEGLLLFKDSLRSVKYHRS